MQPKCQVCGKSCGFKDQLACIWWFTIGRRGEWLCQRHSDELENKMWKDDNPDIVGGDAFSNKPKSYPQHS